MSLSLAQQSWQAMQKAENIAICFYADNSNLLTALSLEYLLKQQDKNVKLFSNQNINYQKFKFLKYPIELNTELNSSYYSEINIHLKNQGLKSFKYELNKINEDEHILNIKIQTKNDHIKTREISLGDRAYNYDLIITINSPNPESLENLYAENHKLFRNLPIINIDFDPNNELYGDINWINIEENSSIPQILSLYQEFAPQLLNQMSASIMMTAVIVNNINQLSYENDGELIKLFSEAGADYHQINSELFYNQDSRYLKILGQVLKNVEIKDKVLMTVIPQILNLDERYLQEVIPHLINDVLKHVKNIETIIVSAEFKTDWKHIFYNIGPAEKNWRKLMNKYHLLGMNRDQLVLSTELEDIKSLQEDFIKLIK